MTTREISLPLSKSETCESKFSFSLKKTSYRRIVSGFDGIIFKSVAGKTTSGNRRMDPQNRCRQCSACFHTNADIANHMAQCFHRPFQPEHPAPQFGGHFLTAPPAPAPAPISSPSPGPSTSTANPGQKQSGKEGKRLWSCPECGKHLGTKASVQMHVATVHQKRRDFVCNICEKALSSKKSLAIHVKNVHHQRRDFECFDCGKEFSSKGSLGVHRKNVHEQRRDFQCHLCKKFFSSNGSLGVSFMTFIRFFLSQFARCDFTGFCNKSTF